MPLTLHPDMVSRKAVSRGFWPGKRGLSSPAAHAVPLKVSGIGREPLEIEKPRSPKPLEGATGKARCNVVPDQPWILDPTIMRLLSPLTGALLDWGPFSRGSRPWLQPFARYAGCPVVTGNRPCGLAAALIITLRNAQQRNHTNPTRKRGMIKDLRRLPSLARRVGITRL